VADSRPRILFITSHWPHARPYGSQHRALNICRLLARAGDLSVIVASIDDPDAETLRKTRSEFNLCDVIPLEPYAITARDRLRAEFDPGFMNTHNRVASPRARDRVLRAIADHDVVWVFGLHEANAFGIYTWRHTVLDIDDVQSRVYAARAGAEGNLARRLLNHRMSWLWRRREQRLGQRFDVVTVCSDDDRRYLEKTASIVVVPNGFATPDSLPARTPHAPPRVGFIGLCEYGPNRDGVEWFIRSAWPLVKRAAPAARLRVVGRGSEHGFSGLGADVDGLGYLDDSASEMATWTATIVPIRFGGGTRVKIAEAFSRRCPIVSTTIGAFGYDVSSDCMLLADDAESFAAACLRLLHEPALGERLAANGWREFQQKWTWDAIESSVAAAIRLCLEKSRTQALEPSSVAAARTDRCDAT
jgi:glycosyltransferase involved in cell wall biosynthesis